MPESTFFYATIDMFFPDKRQHGYRSWYPEFSELHITMGIDILNHSVSSFTSQFEGIVTRILVTPATSSAFIFEHKEKETNIEMNSPHDTNDLRISGCAFEMGIQSSNETWKDRTHHSLNYLTISNCHLILGPERRVYTANITNSPNHTRKESFTYIKSSQL